MDRYSNKVAVVSGASSGIGAAIAERLVTEGMKVVGLARRVEKIEANAARLRDAPGSLVPYKVDVTNEEEVLAVFAWIKKNLGPIDVMVNSAGSMEFTTLLDGDSSKWRYTFDLNVIGTLLCIREAVKVMNRNGYVILMNSIGGHYMIPLPGSNVYGATKFALNNLTEMLRQELIASNTGIRITSISPGGVKSELARKVQTHPALAELTAQILMEPEDIADLVVYVVCTPQRVQVHDVIVRPSGSISLGDHTMNDQRN